MTEQETKKRGWVKNAAIIFLSVMLVLTFFSNTIMNRSLAEVATQYVTSGTITAKIRGTGAVEANEAFNLSISQTREVKSVAVKPGDAVNAGDVLLVLSEADSEELTAAQDMLYDLKLDYQRALLTATAADYARENRDIELAKRALQDAISERDSQSVTAAQLAAAQKAVDTAEANVAAYETSIENIEQAINDLGGVSDGSGLTALSRQISDKQAGIAAAQAEYDAAVLIHQAAYDALEDKAEEKLKIAIADAAVAEGLYDTRADALADTAYINAQLETAAWQAKLPVYVAAEAQLSTTTAEEKNAYTVLTGLQSEISALNTELSRLEQDYNSLLASLNTYQYSLLSAQLKEARTLLAQHTAALTAAQDSLAALETARNNYEAAEEQVEACQLNLENLQFELYEQKKSDGTAVKLEKLDLESKQKDIARQEELVARLSGDSVDSAVTSKVSGIVRSLSVFAGGTTQAGETLAVIEVTDRGYCVSFSVTNEQSKKVAVGDMAEVTNYWGGDVSATLSSIRNDPANPATNKLLTFAVTGQVESGTQLTLSVGQRSADYSMIVPNSAIRSDANGDFVLIITSKNSPLGNRYIATRADVKVLASDEISSAVSGGLSGWDFVITTASKPVEPGDQVRLAEDAQMYF